jgi:hypothetical protein
MEGVNLIKIYCKYICKYHNIFPLHNYCMLIIFLKEARHQWLTPVILATQEAEIRRIAVQSQSRQIVLKDPISKKNTL